MAAFGASGGPQQSAAQRSPWHSPVPYLFGGMAAMLGLIAFALMVLACSYWKLSGYPENRGGHGERDLEAGEAASQPPVMEGKFLVIMAGQEKPTFLATPMSSRSSFFRSKSSCSSSRDNTMSSEEKPEENKRENGGGIVIGGMGSRES